MAGILYICATPIGNLKDTTLRLLDTFKEVDIIASEDTRTTRKLLTKYEISKPLISFRGFKEKSDVIKIMNHLKQGKNIALVSEAGVPGISDPGYLLVKAALEADINVIPIPGASSILTALVVSGLPTKKFTFLGFLPLKKGKRRKALEEFNERGETIIIFESPRRILKTVDELISILGDRNAAISRELTKIHEETLRGSLSSIKDKLLKKSHIKGEIVITVSGVDKKTRKD